MGKKQSGIVSIFTFSLSALIIIPIFNVADAVTLKEISGGGNLQKRRMNFFNQGNYEASLSNI